MTTRTTTTCDCCQRELNTAQHLVVTTRGSRIVGEKHLCDFDCMAKWAPKAAEAEKNRMGKVLRAFPFGPIDWPE